jgi:RimJ/RimL family protein N-acetyltransferase
MDTVDTKIKNIVLRNFQNNDLELMAKWLNKSYIIKWYKNPEEWLSEIKDESGEFSFIHHYIVMIDNAPIGFCQYYDCFYAKEDWYNVETPNDKYSIDYLIGEEAYLNKGYGKAIILLLKDFIFKNEECNEIVVQPEKENVPSNKALLSAGFKFDIEKDYYIYKK